MKPQYVNQRFQIKSGSRNPYQHLRGFSLRNKKNTHHHWLDSSPFISPPLRLDGFDLLKHQNHRKTTEFQDVVATPEARKARSAVQNFYMYILQGWDTTGCWGKCPQTYLDLFELVNRWDAQETLTPSLHSES